MTIGFFLRKLLSSAAKLGRRVLPNGSFFLLQSAPIGLFFQGLALSSSTKLGRGVLPTGIFLQRPQ
ncbi:hypothetical protein HI853_04985 [Cyanobacteria bacterium 150SLHA]|uniref:hypothetical protein n=1 Tax=Prochlorococcus TaxID=1218 RepID=UPI0007B359C9|nr:MULTISPECIES: hypothetical protein [Prochlorococcus]NMP13210.1 hypothetical protein [Prochlorococcus sp.P1363]